MSKKISKVLSILLSASLAAASVPVIQLAAYADDGTTSSTSDAPDPGDKKDDAGLTLNPVVVNYSILDSKGKEQKTIYKNTTFTNKTKTLNIVHIVHLNQTNQQQPQQKSHNPHPLTQTPSKTSSKTPAITNHHRRESIPLINSIAFSKIFFTSDFVTPISFKVL